MSVWKQRWNAFRNPIDPEKERVLRERWESLPEELRTPHQISGRHLTHCAFTLGASYCSFRCTHCYLPENANRVPLPSLADMKEQIDANRRLQGPGGGLQITGGDVADAYWRAGRADELIEIVRYAYSVGVVPMLFTHGQTLTEQPEFLERLVVEGGLRQVAVHIDVTQAGRKGYPIQRVEGEADLHPVRELFTDLARSIRAKTGAPLEFAHNCTVTRKNIDDIPEIIRWFLADPERTKIWRMLSFQPEADTGRTIYSERPVTPALVWEKISEGVGIPLRREASIFGHPDCNSWASLLVSQESGRYTTTMPETPDWDANFASALETVGGLSLVTDDAGTAPYRLAGVIARNPGLFPKIGWQLARHFRRAGVLGDLARAALRGRVHTVGVGMHNFMDAAQVADAPNDATTRCRLDSCVFKGAVKRDGEWEAVPMCSMNERAWGEVYEERLADPALRAEKQIPGIQLDRPASDLAVSATNESTQ